jgi:hypothetical protein
VTRAAPHRGPGRPPLPVEERRRPCNLTLAPATILALDVLAEARGTTRSGAVDLLVAEAMPAALRRGQGRQRRP